MAELYLARASEPARSDQIFVVKLIARRFAEDRSFVTMFNDEARIAAMLDHPNIGRVIDVGQHRSRHFLVMEYLHGKDMRSICRRSLDLKRGPLPFDSAVRVGIKLSGALHYAHTARGPDGAPLNIIHRDVSPSNVMLTFDGRVKLVDFGIAKAANRATLTQPGLIKGKLRYLSPEQVLGINIDHRCDIFILGTTLWECTVGRHLFEGSDEALIYSNISEGLVRPPSSLRADYPPRLERVLMRALAKDRQQRYATASEMQVALEGVANDLGIDLTHNRAALSRELKSLFADEYDRWRQDRHRGVRLIDHLIATLPQAPAALEPLVDVRPVAGPRAGDEPGRRTLLFGEQPSSVSGAIEPAKPKATAGGPISLGAAGRRPPDRKVAGERPDLPPVRSFTPADVPVGDSGPATDIYVVGGNQQAVEPADSLRQTVLDADRQPTRPFIADDGNARTRPFVSEKAGNSVPTHAADDGACSSIDPTLPPGPMEPVPDGASAVDDPDQPLVLDEHLRTGDWASQKAGGKTRPGTHPFFKGDRSAAAPVAAVDAPVVPPGPAAPTAPVERADGRSGRRRPLTDLSLTLPRRFGNPKLILGIIVALALFAVSGVVGWLVANRGNQDPAARATDRAGAVPRPLAEADAAARSTPATAPAAAAPQRQPIEIVTEPVGATAFRATDGRELGKTPLTVDLEALKGSRVELRLTGYRSHQLVVDADNPERIIRVQLQRLVRAKRRVRRPRRRRPVTNDEILDPFSR